MRRLIFVSVAVVVVIVSALAVPIGASPGWYDSDWGERRPVSIDNTGNPNTLTDYQVKVDIAYDSDMQPDFDDLRFTDSDETSELSYWIEDYIPSTSAIVWVEVPSIPASSTRTIYTYYGNPSAASASNGDNTFLFFDDFSGATLDTAKWDDLCDGSGTATIVDGKLRLNSPSGARNHARVKTKMFFGDVCVQHKWWLETWPVCPTIVDNNNARTYFGVYGGDRMLIARLRCHYCQPGLNAYARISSLVYMGGTTVIYAALEDCTLMEGAFKLDRYGTTVHTYYDDTLQLSYDSAFTDSSQLWFDVYGSFGCPPTAADYDDVFVRKYTSPEPTTTVGGEVPIEVEIESMKILFDRSPNRDKIEIKARLQLAEGASFDPDEDHVRVTIDGVVNITIPVGSFVQGKGGDYIFKSPKGVEPKVDMKLKFDKGEWSLKVDKIDASAVDNCDGVDVTFSIGSMGASEYIDMWVDRLSYNAED